MSLCCAADFMSLYYSPPISKTSHPSSISKIQTFCSIGQWMSVSVYEWSLIYRKYDTLSVTGLSLINITSFCGEYWLDLQQ